MFIELIATIFAGLGGAGVLMLLNHLTGKRLPRWFTPVGAGLAMLGTTISNEYGWYNRTLDQLPEGLVIAQAVEHQSWYRPWTHAAPYVERFVAVDTASVQRNETLPDQRLTDLYYFGRWSQVQKLPVLVDCAGARRASLADGAQFTDEGAIADARWVGVAADDPILVTVCEVS